MLMRRKDGGDLLGAQLSLGKGEKPAAMALQVTWDGRRFMPLGPGEAARDYEVVHASGEELVLLAKGPFRRVRVRDR
jgi:hypothetical protein